MSLQDGPSSAVLNRQDRWGHLVSVAFHLDDRVARHGPDRDAAAAVVASALEVFAADLDPLDDFEGYAVRRLLLSLREALR